MSHSRLSIHRGRGSDLPLEGSGGGLSKSAFTLDGTIHNLHQTRIMSLILIVTARVAKRVKVMFSQAFVCSTAGGGVTPNASWERSHGQGGGGQHLPPPQTELHQPLPPDRITPTPPDRTTPTPFGEDHTYPPLNRITHYPPPRPRQDHTYPHTIRELRSMRRWVVHILLECILVLYFYQQQGKVMFLEACLSHSVHGGGGGGYPSIYLGRVCVSPHAPG